MNCETNDCNREKMTCKGCYYEERKKINDLADKIKEAVNSISDEEMKHCIEIADDITKEERTADEMFEELGYRKTESKSYISYRGKMYSRFAILFNKNDKSIVFENFNNIEMQQLQAINKKVEELGWK